MGSSFQKTNYTFQMNPILVSSKSELLINAYTSFISKRIPINIINNTCVS